MSLSIAITGCGAVSPAGWGVGPLMAALRAGERCAVSEIERPLGDTMVRTPVLRVPMEGANVPKAARLRRASPISKFAAAAAFEALGEERVEAVRSGAFRVGVIFTVTNGCVNYSNRFFGEALADPAMASPILFPETVFNAPSSHLATIIGSTAPNDTLIGDSAGFFTGMDLAIEWISRGDVHGCLVIAAEETDWLSAEGLRLYSPDYLPAEGAAAILLEAGDGPVNVLTLPDPVPLSHFTRAQATAECRARLAVGNSAGTLLVDGRCGAARFDQAESGVWADWQGPKWSPRMILGESMGASAGLQTVAAVRALMDGTTAQAVITATGGNQHAAGLVIGRSSID